MASTKSRLLAGHWQMAGILALFSEKKVSAMHCQGLSRRISSPYKSGTLWIARLSGADNWSTSYRNRSIGWNGLLLAARMCSEAAQGCRG